MAIVFIVPKGNAPLTKRYVVETAGDDVLRTSKTQKLAIDWAKENSHTVHVARVRKLRDKRVPAHWRKVK
jgi:hypothetical protein